MGAIVFGTVNGLIGAMSKLERTRMDTEIEKRALGVLARDLRTFSPQILRCYVRGDVPEGPSRTSRQAYAR